MNEQRTTIRLADQVAELFTENADDARHAQEIRDDLRCLSREELVAGLQEASGVAEGVVVASEALSIPTYTVFADTRRRVQEVLMLVEL